MIFDPCRFCRVEERWDKTLAQPALLQGEGVWVGLVSSGRCALQSRADAALAGPGSLLLCPAGATLVPVEPAHLLAVRLAGEAPLACAKGLDAPFFVDCGLVPQAPEALALLCGEETGVSLARASALGYQLLCEAVEASARPAALPPLVAGAIAAIRQNYAGLYGVEELSASLGVSKSHLVRAFSAAVGVPPGQYLTAVRLEAAKQLLMHREYPLEVVASLCGFSGANYLCRVFRRHTGQTPAQWRALHLDVSPAETPLAGEAELYI